MTDDAPVSDERKKVDDIYSAARVAAMAEFDQLQPEWRRLGERLTNLRWIINGVSYLLGDADTLPDEYRFMKDRTDYGMVAGVQKKEKKT